MENIKVSIIMPCLNAKKFIEESIESIINQTLKELEIIIVDAGSVDGTVEIIKSYQKKDSRIKFIESSKKSLGYQYNIGIHNATGKYIGFVESDDYIHSMMYERLYNIAEEQILDFVKSDFDMFIEDNGNHLLLNYSILSSKKDNLYGQVINPKDYPDILYRDVNMWNGIFNKKFLIENQVILNETEGAAFQDMGFVIKNFVSANRAMYIKIPSYYYRKDNMNASVYNYTRHIRFVTDEFRFVWEYMTDKHISTPFRAVIFKRCFSMFCAYYDYIRFHGEFSESIQEKVDQYIDYFRECFMKLKYSELREEKLDDSLSLRLLDNKEGFETVRKYIDYSERMQKIDFYNMLKGRLLIIFGAGEYGTACYAFLRRNHVETILCFCDNDKNKEHKKIMGKICVSPESVQMQYQDELPKILFIIANELHHREIKKQLLDMGVEGDNIIQCLNILPHSAFELDMEELKNE